MKLKKMIAYVLIAFSLTNCNKDVNWDDEQTVSFSSSSDIDQIIEISEDQLKINKLNLEVSSIEVFGKRLQSSDITYFDESPMSFIFNENTAEQIYDLNIPIGTYESLVFKINFDTSNSGFIIGEVDNEFSPEHNQHMEVPLEIENTIELTVLNEENEPLILVNESLKSFELNFKVQTLFESVKPSLWNILLQANQGQSEIDLTTLVGAEFINEVNEEIELSFSLKAIR